MDGAAFGIEELCDTRKHRRVDRHWQWKGFAFSSRVFKAADRPRSLKESTRVCCVEPRHVTWKYQPTCGDARSKHGFDACKWARPRVVWKVSNGGLAGHAARRSCYKHAIATRAGDCEHL